MVIVTASIGHLKANVNSMFVPALPQAKLQAISVYIFSLKLRHNFITY